MASAERTEIFKCTPEQFFSIITDYSSYPSFLSEVKKCQVVQEGPQGKLVEFQVSVIKTFSYKLWIKEEPYSRLSWHLDSGDVFKTSVGSWTLQPVPGGTQIVYRVEATFKGFVPGPISKALVQVNLPNMMKAYHQRVTQLFGSEKV